MKAYSIQLIGFFKKDFTVSTMMHMSVILVLERVKADCHEFIATLSYIVS